MGKNKVAEVHAKLVELLEPFDPEERQRAILAAQTVLGDAPSASQQAIQDSSNDRRSTNAGNADNKVPSVVATWMTKQDISQEQLDEWVHINGDEVQIIANEVPGSSKRKQAINCYLLQGLGSFVQSGHSTFTDEAARMTCQHFGCYDSANHSKIRFGNMLAGSKRSGWKLTNPGLRAAVSLINPQENEG